MPDDPAVIDPTALRYCRKCKQAFPQGADGIYRCPSGHPNFNYTKAIPAGADVFVPPGSELSKPVTAASRSLPAKVVPRRQSQTPAAEAAVSVLVPAAPAVAAGGSAVLVSAANGHSSPKHEPEAALDTLQTRSLRDQWRARAERAEGVVKLHTLPLL